jgi:hypothetical protein
MWNVVRVKCLLCDSTDGIAYQMIDGKPDRVTAENCRSYVKILGQAKDRRLAAFRRRRRRPSGSVLMAKHGCKRVGQKVSRWDIELRRPMNDSRPFRQARFPALDTILRAPMGDITSARFGYAATVHAINGTLVDGRDTVRAGGATTADARVPVAAAETAS